MIFRGSLFIKRPYIIFLLTFIMFKHGMKCLDVFFFLFPTPDGISFLSFLQGWVYPGMKFHLGQKRVNSKRHFTIGRDDFIPGWNFKLVNTLLDVKTTFRLQKPHAKTFDGNTLKMKAVNKEQKAMFLVVSRSDVHFDFEQSFLLRAGSGA